MDDDYYEGNPVSPNLPPQIPQGMGMMPSTPISPESMPVHNVPKATYHHKGTVHKGKRK